MALEIVLSCPLCNNKSFEKFLSCQDHTSSKELFDINNCRNCGFIFTSPRPDQNSIGNYYKSNSYISHSRSSKGLINNLYLIARRYTLESKIQLLHTFFKKGTILDYGCGTGEFLFTSSQNGFITSGIEPSDDARAKAATLNSKEIFRDISEIETKQFDIITMWHVLEHISDFKDVVEKLKKTLNPNGIISIAVPNHESYDAKYYKESWAGYDVPRHLSHFSKKTMTALLVESNLKLLEIKPMKLDAYYVSMLSEKYKHPEQNSIQTFARGMISGFKSNQKAKKEMNYSSLIYIARP